ncbi:hypothetical protein E4U42_004322 [Claviceps africana]|uniref:Uncharacterized protein n=1 Tax=Claviceps africana TaxID=83212 RepID=A0A8K0NKW1_9HYPO|nr:hypothetical protein E4U42_004322 [Claviceps africana]
MSTFEEANKFEDELSRSPPSAGDTSSSDGSKYNTIGTRDIETVHVGDVTVDTEYTQDLESEPERQDRATKEIGVAKTTEPPGGLEKFTEALEKWEDSMLVCRQLLENIPQVQRCLRPEDLNPAEGLCSSGWRAMEEYRAATRMTEPPSLDLSIGTKQNGRETDDGMDKLWRTQTTVVGFAHETLFIVMSYLAMLAPMLKYVDLQCMTSPWGTDGHRTAGDAEMETVQDLVGQIERLKEEKFALKRQVAAATAAAAAAAAAASKKESAQESSLTRSQPGLCPRCRTAMLRPEMRAKSSAWNAMSSELQSVARSRSVGSVPLVAAAADSIMSRGENIADLVEESLLPVKEQVPNGSDTFSEGQAELLQKPTPARRQRPCLVSDWLSQANTTGSWDDDEPPTGRTETVCAYCGGDRNREADASLAAKYRDIMAENHVLDADFQQLAEEYDVLEATHENTMDEYNQLIEQFEEIEKQHDLLRNRYDHERDVHNRVTAMYVTKTSGVRWNEARHARTEPESLSVSPKTTARPFRKSSRRPSSSAAPEHHARESSGGSTESQDQSLYAFLSEQWLCWIAFCDLIWTMLQGVHPDPILISEGSEGGQVETQLQNGSWARARQQGPSTWSRVSGGRGISWRALLTMLTHLTLLAALLSWYSCQLERDIWLQANGLTRNQLIAHTRGELVWLSNLGLDGGWITGEARTLVLWMGLNSRRVMAFVSGCVRRMM